METFKKSYAPYIDLMPRSEEWPIDRDIEPIMHHLPRKQHGIPKKVRRRGVNENEPYESMKTVVNKATMIGAAPNRTSK